MKTGKLPFSCSNFGFVAQCNSEDGNELLPAKMVEIAQKMGLETEICGKQAGGGMVLARDGDRCKLKALNKHILKFLPSQGFIMNN